MQIIDYLAICECFNNLLSIPSIKEIYYYSYSNNTHNILIIDDSVPPNEDCIFTSYRFNLNSENNKINNIKNILMINYEDFDLILTKDYMILPEEFKNHADAFGIMAGFEEYLLTYFNNLPTNPKEYSCEKELLAF